jgi:hypothetical protein
MAIDTPDPRLRALDLLVGEWDLHHRDLNTGETWLGHDRFAWMDGGFFLTVEHEEFGKNIKGTMIIGFEKRWGEETPSEQIIGHWFESTTGFHFVYFWEVNDRTVRFSFEKPDTPVRFLGHFNEDHSRIEGEWHLPDGGGYALTMTRVSAS